MAIDNNNKFIFYSSNIEAKSYYDEATNKIRYFVKGHVDSEDLDLVGDIITKSCIDDMSLQFKNRNIKLDFDHETLRKGLDENDFDAKLNLTKVPLGRAISESTDKKGNLVKFELNPNWKKFSKSGEVIMTFQEVWENIKSKMYDSFSIAYVPIKTAYKSIDGREVRLLDKLNLINIALTGNPVNPSATMTEVMAKSLAWIKNKEVEEMEAKSNDELIKEIKDLKSEFKSEIKSLKSEIKSMSEKEEDEKEKEDKPEKKSQLEKQIEEMAKQMKSVNEFMSKSLNSGLGPEDKSEMESKSNDIDEKSLGNNTLDFI